MVEPRIDAPVRDEAPSEPSLTDYDRLHLIAYLRRGRSFPWPPPNVGGGGPMRDVDHWRDRSAYLYGLALDEPEWA